MSSLDPYLFLSFNELGTPIKAMFKMWSKKAKALRSEFVEQNNTYPAELDTRKGNIPLGWRLSKQSRKDISTQILCGGFGSLYDAVSYTHLTLPTIYSV